MIEKNYWWLSFADSSGFLGGCMVEADSAHAAIVYTHEIGINPGGGVKILPVEDIGDCELDRLYSKQDLEDEQGGAVRF